METSYLAAHAFSGADLLHGPLAMIDEDRPVVAVVPHGVAGASDGSGAGTAAVTGAPTSPSWVTRSMAGPTR